jgi:hypothetical protein
MRSDPVSRRTQPFGFACVEMRVRDEKHPDDTYSQNCNFGPVKNRPT